MMYLLIIKTLLAPLRLLRDLVLSTLAWNPFTNTRMLLNFAVRPTTARNNFTLLQIKNKDKAPTVLTLVELGYNLLLWLAVSATSAISWLVVHHFLILALLLLLPINTVKFIWHEIFEKPKWLLKNAKDVVLCIKHFVWACTRKCVAAVNYPLHMWAPKQKFQINYWLAESSAYKVCFILFTITYSYLLSCEAQNFSTSVITSFVFVMPAYLLWQTFTYFFKTYHISKYTTQVASFWQRTYLVFWSLEISLYLIFVFIWFISPEAPKMTIGHTLNLKVINESLVAVIDIFNSLLLLLVINIFLLLKKNYQNVLITGPFLFIALYLYTSILVDEYRYFIYNSAQWSAMVESMTYEGTLSKGGNKVLLGSTESQVLLMLDNYNPGIVERANEELVAQMTYSVLWFLRFWHVVLIFLMFTFFTLKWIRGHVISFESLAMNISNVVILVIFNLTYLIFYIKTVGKEHLMISPRGYGLDEITNLSYCIALEVLNTVGF